MSPALAAVSGVPVASGVVRAPAMVAVWVVSSQLTFRSISSPMARMGTYVVPA